MPIIPSSKALAPVQGCPERRFRPGQEVPHTVGECDDRLALFSRKDGRVLDVWLDERLRAMHGEAA